MNALLPVALLQQQALINLCGLTSYRQCFMIQQVAMRTVTVANTPPPKNHPITPAGSKQLLS